MRYTVVLTSLVFHGCDANHEIATPPALTLDELVFSPQPNLSESELTEKICEHFPRVSSCDPTYVTVHKHAATVLPFAVQLESEFEHTDHFITHYGMDQPTIWNTVSFIADRYVLTVQVPVLVDYHRKRFVIESEAVPKFVIVEAVECGRDGGTSFDARSQRNFALEEFRDLVESNWDWQTIGLKFVNEPVRFFEIYRCMARAPRIPITLKERRQ